MIDCFEVSVVQKLSFSYLLRLFMNMFTGNDSAQQGTYDHLRWLEEIDIPKNLKMDGVEYLGPQIIDG